MNAYVIVEHAGRDDQREITDFPSRRAAFLYLTEYYTVEERETFPVDVMKRLPDGTLTTEF